MPQFLSTSDPDFETAFAALLSAKREDSPDVDAVVADIIADVRARGDAAVLELTAKFDRLEIDAAGMAFSDTEIGAACASVSEADRAALELAAERIRAYHKRQMPDDARWEDEAGASLGWRWTAVSAAGLYVPGGLATYPSSVLMNAIPAKVAGVERLAMVVPTPDGEVTLGFRAEDAGVVGTGGQLNAAIYTMELLGDATMVSVRIGGSLVSVKADKSYRAEISDSVSISVPQQQCHLFDATTGTMFAAAVS